MVPHRLARRNYGGKLQVSIKYQNLCSFKEGMMSKYPWNETKSHLHGSAPFTVPLKLSESHKNATYLLKNSVSLFFITEISNWVKDETTKKMKEHENYTLLLDEATVGPNFLLLPLLQSLMKYIKFFKSVRAPQMRCWINFQNLVAFLIRENLR